MLHNIALDLVHKGRISRELSHAYTHDACERDVLAPCTSPTHVSIHSYARINSLIRALARYKAPIRRVHKHRAYTREIRPFWTRPKKQISLITFQIYTYLDLVLIN